MDKNFEEFLDKTIDDISEMYSNDEFRDGYAEAVDTFKNTILNYAEENKNNILQTFIIIPS